MLEKIKVAPSRLANAPDLYDWDELVQEAPNGLALRAVTQAVDQPTKRFQALALIDRLRELIAMQDVVLPTIDTSSPRVLANKRG
jgi:hypothetical protein